MTEMSTPIKLSILVPTVPSRIINTRAAILNFGKRTLGGRKIKHNRTYKRKAKI
jgi:hypothetical protein